RRGCGFLRSRLGLASSQLARRKQTQSPERHQRRPPRFDRHPNAMEHPWCPGSVSLLLCCERVAPRPPNAALRQIAFTRSQSLLSFWVGTRFVFLSFSVVCSRPDYTVFFIGAKPSR